MPGYLITYDLKNPGRDYPKVYKLLSDTWKCGRVAESVWIGSLKGPASAIRDHITAVTDANDRVFVVELKPNCDWASKGALQAGINVLKTISP